MWYKGKRINLLKEHLLKYLNGNFNHCNLGTQYQIHPMVISMLMMFWEPKEVSLNMKIQVFQSALIVKGSLMKRQQRGISQFVQRKQKRT
jgi:hypothetical protein